MMSTSIYLCSSLNWGRGSTLIPTYCKYVDITEVREVAIRTKKNKMPQVPNPTSLSVVGSTGERGGSELPIGFTTSPITYYVALVSMLFLLYKIA